MVPVTGATGQPHMKPDPITLDALMDLFKVQPMIPKLRGKKPVIDKHTGEPVMVRDPEKSPEVPENIRKRIEELLARPDVDGLCVFRVIAMDSSQFGRTSVMPFGPGCATFKKEEDAYEKHLNDLPSQRQYLTNVYRKKDHQKKNQSLT